MLESNLVAGAQKLVPGEPLVYGQSITDACMGWDETLELLAGLAKAVRAGDKWVGGSATLWVEYSDHRASAA